MIDSDESEDDEVLSGETASSDESTTAPWSEHEFEMVIPDENDDIEAVIPAGGEFEMIDPEDYESEADSECESSDMNRWWALGSEGPFRFLMLLSEHFVIMNLGIYSLSSSDELPNRGWVLDEGPLLEHALHEERLNS